MSFLSCKNDQIISSNTSESPQSFVGPNNPCGVYFNLFLESYSFVSTNDGSSLDAIGTIQCALQEPMHFQTQINGCVDPSGNGTLTMQCSPSLFDFPNLDEIPPDLEPQECEITIDGSDIQIVDEAGGVIFDGPFTDNPFEPISAGWLSFIQPIAVQVQNLEMQATQRGGQVYQPNHELRILKFPSTVDDPATIITYNPVHNTLLSKTTFNENTEIDYSIYYHYDGVNDKGEPKLSKITERERFSLESYPDIPLIKKNHYTIHNLELDIN